MPLPPFTPPSRARRLVALAALGVLLVTSPASAGATWPGLPWADPGSAVYQITPAMQAHLQAIRAQGEAAGRVEGRMGQIGDSITESSAYFRNAILNGETDNETGANYDAVRSWLAYAGAQPADANSFYRNHGKGVDYGNRSGWTLEDAIAAGHPSTGVLTGDGTTPGDYSWVLIMFGTNDIDDGGWSAGPWEADYRAFVQGYVALGVIPVLSTIPPESAHVGDGRVEAANQAIANVAASEGLPLLDFYAVILQYQPTGWAGTLISGDGTHPSSASGGRSFAQTSLTETDGYALRTKLAFDFAAQLKALVWDGEPAVVGAPLSSAAPAALRATPNPFRASVRLDGAPGPWRIWDVSGRLVRELTGGDSREWDGRSEGGDPAPAGVYWARPTGPGAPPAVRIVRLR